MALTKIAAAGLTADLIDETKLADNSIDSEHYNDGSIDNAHLADNAVDTDEIADDAVTADKLANSINTEIAANTAKVTNATHSGEVTGATALTIADNAVTLAKMAGGTDGQIITYDASGDPVAVGPGTDGQVLTSTGAGSPPAFETLPTSGATLSGSTDNTVVTVTGANAMQGEANLTFDGTYLGAGVTPAANEGRIQAKTSDNIVAKFTRNNTGNYSGAVQFGNNDRLWSIYGSNSACAIKNITGSQIVLEADTSHNVKINAGNLVIGTSGKGIDFSATSDAGGMENELLDDYEEGSWTPVLKDAASGGNTYSGGGNWTTYASYTKIGRIVHVYHVVWSLSDTGMTGGNGIYVHGFPFTASGTHVTSVKLQYFKNFADDEFGPYIQVNNGETIGRLHKQHNEGGATSNVPIKWEDKHWDNYYGFQYYMTYQVS